MIEVSNLTKRFGDIHALNDVSFSVEKGKIVGFLGANGAGKTTTMDIICGCIGADKGNSKICNIDISENPIEAKKKLGYLPDVPPLHVEMRVKEYIAYSAKIHGVPSKDISSAVNDTMEKLSLTKVKDRVIGNLSKGYRHRVAFAQALVHDPEVLILDEPTEGLDPNQIIQIRELIKSLSGQHTIMLSSHILSEVQNTCDHIIIINEGTIVQQGSYDELVNNMESGGTYCLKVENDADRLVTELSSISGISTPKLEGDDIEFALGSEKAPLDAVAKMVLDGNHGLRELTLKTQSLEEIFMKLTH